MGARWGISRSKLFGYALNGVCQYKESTYRTMVESESAEEIEKNSRVYMEAMKDYDAIVELIKRETSPKPVSKKK